MGNWRLLLLGPPRIETDKRVTRIKLRKAIALVAYLAIEKRAFSREYLAALLWPDLGRKSALANLRQTLSILRGTLENGGVVTDGDQVQLSSAHINTDIDEFHSLTTPKSSDTDLARLETASELYRGRFLEGFALGDCLEFDEWQDAVRERLQSELDTLLEALSTGYLEMGRPKSALPFALRWLELDRLNEAAHRALMEIYARIGRKGAALKQFESCTRVLTREGFAPEDHTRELNGAIVESRLTRSPGPAGPKRPSTKERPDVPYRLATLVGAVVLAGIVVVGPFHNETGSSAEVFEVEIKYSGYDPLDHDNPLIVFIGDRTQHRGPGDWGEFEVTGEGTYSFPLDHVPLRDNDGSGYFMLIVHDAGSNLQHPYYADPGDVAGLYREVRGNLVYGGFNLAGGSPVHPGERYSIEFSLPPLPTPDGYEVDDWDNLGTSLDYADLPVRQYHTFHDDGSGDMDRDWYRVFLPADGSLTVETVSAGGQWEVDTAIDLCDSEMNYIQSSHDKAWQDNYSKLTYVNDTGVDQVFHFLVKPYNQYSAWVHKVGEYIVEFRDQK